MPDRQLQIESLDGENLAELRHDLGNNLPGLLSEHEPRRGGGFITELIVSLASAGAFTALYNTVTAYLQRHENKRLELRTENGSLIISGHDAVDVAVLLERLGLGSELKPQSTESRPPAPTIDFSAAIEQIEAVLEAERQKGIDYDSNRNYWRLTGQLVLNAVYVARKAIFRNVDMLGENIDFRSAIEDLSVAKRGFDVEFPDEDGYLSLIHI